MLLGVQHSELVQRLSDTARPCELRQEEAKATGRSVHFVTLELCELTRGLAGGLPGVGEGLSAPTAAGQKHRMTDGRTQVGRAPRWPHDRDGDARPKSPGEGDQCARVHPVGNCVGRNRTIAYYEGFMGILAEGWDSNRWYDAGYDKKQCCCSETTGLRARLERYCVHPGA